MLSHTGEKPFICKQCNYLFVYLHIRHPGTSFLRSSYNYIFKNIAYVIVYVWPSRTWDEILLPFQKGLFFPLGDIRLFLPTRIRICAYAHHPTWIRHGRIRMAIPNFVPTGQKPNIYQRKKNYGSLTINNSPSKSIVDSLQRIRNGGLGELQIAAQLWCNPASPGVSRRVFLLRVCPVWS